MRHLAPIILDVSIFASGETAKANLIKKNGLFGNTKVQVIGESC